MNCPNSHINVSLFKSTPSHLYDISTSNGTKDKSNKSIKIEEKKVIVCAFCGNSITDVSQIISVNGSHQHVFVNPHGIVFDTICFNQCDGCIVDSSLSSEFSWFHGYSWKVAGCNRCYRHLGWLFLLDNINSPCNKIDTSLVGVKSFLYKSFYCLILQNIIIP
ncbi:MAG: hypothetical protein HQK72_05975 [Desulfamplus sp.]|nr:hypothetical protein [Desulfamplus sp.]